MEITPVPGGGPERRLGLGDPQVQPDPEAAWTFLKWIESPEIVKKRAMLGGSPTRTDVFDDPGLSQKFPYYPAAASSSC